MQQPNPTDPVAIAATALAMELPSQYDDAIELLKYVEESFGGLDEVCQAIEWLDGLKDTAQVALDGLRELLKHHAAQYQHYRPRAHIGDSYCFAANRAAEEINRIAAVIRRVCGEGE